MVSAPNSGTHTSVFVRSFDAYALAHDLCARIRCVGASPTSQATVCAMAGTARSAAPRAARAVTILNCIVRCGVSAVVELGCSRGVLDSDSFASFLSS